ncbi:MAG: hypothetical protein ACREMG_08990 [Gemmatimonadales bacterium]
MIADRLAEAVLVFNRPYKNPLRGAEIHRIDALTAVKVARLIAGHAAVLERHMEAAPPGRGLRAVAYLAAVIGQESRFDPRAVNLNLPPALGILNAAGIGRPDWSRGDFGIGQFKLKYIRLSTDAPELHGLPEREVVERFLYDPDWAVPKVAARYAGLLRWAEAKVAGFSKRWAAAGAYNRGQTGFLEAYALRSGPVWEAAWRHMSRVMGHFDLFLKAITETERREQNGTIH